MKKVQLISNDVLFDYNDIVKREEKKTDSGLHIPETAKSMEDMVIAPTHTVKGVGKLCKHVKEGDVIVLHPGAGGVAMMLSKDEKYIIFKEHEVIAIIE